MSNQLYSIQYININGKVLMEHVSAEVSRSANSQPVITVGKGYSGESPGAPMTMIDVKSAIPADGMELDAGDYISGLIPVQVGALIAGKEIRIEGFIVEDSFSHAANSESAYSFKMRGPFGSLK